MGWLREHSALKVTSIKSRSEGPFDRVPINDSLHEREQVEWQQWRKRLDEARREIVAQAMHEFLARGCAKPNRGRPSALSSYKNYKLNFLRDWAQFITQAAKKKDGLNQHDLAAAFGFTEANQWRDIKRGAKHYRMTHERFIVKTKEVVLPRGWNTLRRGNLTTLWTQYLMNPAQYAEWLLRQNCVTEGANTY